MFKVGWLGEWEETPHVLGSPSIIPVCGSCGAKHKSLGGSYGKDL